MKKISRKILGAQAGVVAGLIVGARDAKAANDWSDIAENIVVSVEALPGLVTGIAYLFGLLLGVLGVLKVKDHVENPGQTPLKDGAIRLAAGGALFALPIITEAMLNTVGDVTATVGPAELNKVELLVN